METNVMTGQLPPDFGESLAALRQGKKTQAELAGLLGIDGSTVSRYERGDLTPSVADAQKLLKAVGTVESLDYATYIGQQWTFLPRPAYGHPDRSSLWSAEATLRRLADVRQTMGTESVDARAELLESALKREADYLQSVDHDIAFFGQIAVGKTTALCTIAALMLPMAPGERRIKRTVLEVGGGNVTICEVVVRHDPRRYGLIVVPQSEDEVTLCINDLCAGIVSAEDGEGGLDGERRGLSKEVDRALRHMCGLAKRQERQADRKRVTIDPMLDLANGRNLKALASEVFNRVKLSQRTETELWYDASSGEEPEAWLRKTFAMVNNGLNPVVGLPKKISVVAPLRTLADKPYELRMIDTRGIDEPQADRPDLRAYLEDPRTIPVLCSPFVGPLASSVAQLVQSSDETGAGVAVSMRSIVLLLAKNDEALQVKHDGGEPLESFDEGYEIRNERAREDLRRIGRNIGQRRPEVISFNSDTDDPEALLGVLMAKIESVRSARRNRIEEIGAAVSAMADEASKVGLASVYAQVHNRLREVNIAKLRPQVFSPFERLIAGVRERHARTVWASVVRQGSWINLDVFHYLGMGVAADAEKRSRAQVTELQAAIGLMLADNDFAPVNEFLKEAMSSVVDWHGDFVQSAGRLGKDAFRPALKEATQLWSMCAAEYGTGLGFREPVARHLEQWFSDDAQRDVLKLVDDSLAENWSTVFVRNVEKLINSVRPATGSSYVSDSKVSVRA